MNHVFQENLKGMHAPDRFFKKQETPSGEFLKMLVFTLIAGDIQKGMKFVYLLLK